MASWARNRGDQRTRWSSGCDSTARQLKRRTGPTVVGDTVGDPFKDTSSVATNPVIKFTTLFGLLAVELAVSLTAERGAAMSLGFAALFFAASLVFVWRSFYAMRIRPETPAAELARPSAH